MLYFLCTLNAFSFFGINENGNGEVFVRPSWVPLWLMHVAKRAYKGSVIATVVAGCLLASGPDGTEESLSLRLLFFTTIFFAHLWNFAVLQNHSSFALLYTSAAMLIPEGPARNGALRVLVGYVLASSGLCRLRIGGCASLGTEAAKSWLNFCVGHDDNGMSSPGTSGKIDKFDPDFQKSLVQKYFAPPMQPWLTKFVLSRVWLLTLSHFSGFALEVLALPMALFGGPYTCMILFMAGCFFHTMIALMTDIFFPYQYFMYAYALLRPTAQDPSCLLNVPSAVVLLTCGCMHLCCAENWPFSAMALFPYNGNQVSALRKWFGVFRLKPIAPDGPRVSKCVCVMCLQAFPSIYVPGFMRAVGLNHSTDYETTLKDPVIVRTKIIEWLRKDRPFVDQTTFQCFEDLLPAYNHEVANVEQEVAV